MKKILLKASLFCVIILTLVIANQIVVNSVLDAKLKFKIKEKAIIVGHSHAACAYIDSLTIGVRNLADSGESYFYTFQKIKKIIKDNPQINVVFIEFSNDNIDSSMNRWVFEEPFISNRMPKYSPFMEFKDHLILIQKNPINYLNCFILSLKINNALIFEPSKFPISLLGGYTYNNKSKISLIKKQKYFVENKDFPRTHFRYLNKIIHFLTNHKIKPVLIRTKCHDYSIFNQNDSKYKFLISKYFSNLDFIDFKNLNLGDSYFYDNEHLNNKGAKIISKIFYKRTRYLFNEKVSK